MLQSNTEKEDYKVADKVAGMKAGIDNHKKGLKNNDLDVKNTERLPVADRFSNFRINEKRDDFSSCEKDKSQNSYKEKCQTCKNYNAHPEYCKWNEGGGIIRSFEKCKGDHYELIEN